MELTKLKERLKGRWYDVLITAGINEDYLTGKHCPCPVCGGEDRFRFDDKDGEGTWYCNQCEKQAGDGFALLQKKFGYSFSEILVKVENILWTIIGNDPDNNTEKRVTAKKADPKKSLNTLWTSGHDIAIDDTVHKYFKARKLTVKPDNIRFVKECYEPEEQITLPAMIAKVVNQGRIPISIHRTYLNTTSPGKANIANPKKLMPGTQPLMGSAIRLFTPGGGVYDPNILGVAEGIETAMATTQLFKVATWSLISTTLMEGWTPPKEFKQILIFGDNDTTFAGQKSAMTLASRLSKLGLLVVVKIPPETNSDWADVLFNQQ